MSYVGKILVVFQLVLSVAFMAFAGVVYTAHMNWRNEALKQRENVKKKQGELDSSVAESQASKRELTAKVTAAEQKATELDAIRKTVEQELARIKKESADLQVARKTASEQSLIAGQDSAARKSEADNQRVINHALTAQRDVEFAERVKLEDEKRSLEIELDAARSKNKDLIGKVAVLQQALDAAGLASDVTELATRNSPPPRVEGKVTDVKPAKRQGASELVEVSLGSDDGLKKGHEMTVYSSGLSNNQRARYKARILIVSTTPDKSVGQVIESSRNGIIQKGDNVSTKL